MSHHTELLVIVPRQGLWDRLQPLMDEATVREALTRVEHAHFSPWCNRNEQFTWKPGFFSLINDPWPIDRVERSIREIKAGADFTRREYESFNIRVGAEDPRYRSNEQLYLDLHFSKRTLNFDAWQRPDQCIFEIVFPTEGHRYVQDHIVIRPLLGAVLELLQPDFAFSASDLAYDWYRDRGYCPPWEEYWETMVFGPALVAGIGLERLQATPAFRLIELEGPLIWISSPAGIGDENFGQHVGELLSETGCIDHPVYTDRTMRDLHTRAWKEHKRAVIEHLGLKQ